MKDSKRPGLVTWASGDDPQIQRNIRYYQIDTGRSHQVAKKSSAGKGSGRNNAKTSADLQIGCGPTLSRSLRKPRCKAQHMQKPHKAGGGSFLGSYVAMFVQERRTSFAYRNCNDISHALLSQLFFRLICTSIHVFAHHLNSSQLFHLLSPLLNSSQLFSAFPNSS